MGHGEGRYRVTMHYSPGFKRWQPHLLDVPGYEYIMIRLGNWIHNSKGCLMPGRTYSITKGGAYQVNDSAKVVNPLIKEINNALERGEEVWCEVV